MSIIDDFAITPQFDCSVKDWIRISETPDGYWYRANDFPTNSYAKYIYPHSDSVCVGGVFFTKLPNTLREIIEGKLTKPLIADHHYKFSIYVQLFDTMHVNNAGKIVSTNSFSALFTDTAIPSYQDLPIQNYTPQVQINTMVTDTQHWVLLMDTFMANGGEQYISIGNFKPDSLTQFILVDSQSNLPEASYYYMDDVSLIDLDDTTNGMQEQLAVKNNQLMVYPNPAKESIVVSCKSLVITVVVTDVLGRIQMVRQAHHDGDVLAVDSPLERGLGGFELNTNNLPSGIYFIKATDTKGNVSVGKFVKE